MDHSKIHDTQFQHIKYTNKKNIASLLSPISVSKQSSYRVSQLKYNRKILPSYKFRFRKFHIKNHVEYNVDLEESYFVLGREMCNKYSFITRYSLLQKLSQHIGTEGFPHKLYFDNKKEKKIKQRIEQLQAYLNKHSRKPSKLFLQFIKQIKQNSPDNIVNKKMNL